MPAVVVLLLAQCVYSTKDIIMRSLVKNHNFGVALFSKPLFYLMIVLQIIGITLQLYILSSYTLSRTMTGFAVLSIIFSAVLGFLILGEHISSSMYLAIVLAFASFVVLVFAVK